MQRRAHPPVVAPVGERLEQLTKLVQIGAHLQTRDARLLIDDTEKTTRFQRQLEKVANVFALRRGMQLKDVAHIDAQRSHRRIKSFDRARRQ